MAKKRKTRSQKVAADFKRQDSSYQATTSSNSLTYTPQAIPKTTVVASRPHNLINEYKFVRHDLIKTSSITGAIIIVELMLSFLMTKI